MRGGWVFKFRINTIGLVALLSAAPVFAGDPTLPPTEQLVGDAVTQAPETLQLQAILRGPSRASAVINGQKLTVGDRLGDARVLAVRAHSVVIERQGRQQELRLSAPIIQTSRTLP